MIRQLIRVAGEWRMGFGSERIDDPVPGKSGPYAALSACVHDGRFFGGGHVQSAGRDIARVRLAWDDGCQLDDEVENGIVLFLGLRDRGDRAMVEFLDRAASVVTCQTL